MDIVERKNTLRKEIALLKKGYDREWKESKSTAIFDIVEELDEFKNASTILIYHALPDEVQTMAFLNKWYDKKRLLLPVVVGDDLILKVYHPECVEVGYCSILEPTDTEIVDPKSVDLAIVPGVAFDMRGNRLGRGRGFYDRLLSSIKCEVIGVAYPFQVVDEVPTQDFDKKLSRVITI